MKTLVLGVGNTLLSDEGVGIHAIEAMEKSYPECSALYYLDGGTLSFTLALEIESCDNLIVVDAADIGQAAGNIDCMRGEVMDTFLGRGKLSVHEVGLVDLLDIARLTQTLPGNRALIAIQPHSVDWGERLTTSVASAIPKSLIFLEQLMDEWYGGRESWQKRAPTVVTL